MKRKCIITLLGIALFIMFWASPAYTKTWARANGTVTTEKGIPIEGARVILVFSEDGSKIEQTTDNKGKWINLNLRSGAWTIGFMADGYQPENINVILSAIKDHPPIDIILKTIPKHPLSQGNELYQDKKYTEALNEYQRVLGENPDLPQVHEKIGLCYYRLGDLDNAIKAFKTLLEKKPDTRNVQITLTSIYLEKGNLEEGMKYLQQLDEETINEPSIFYNIGVLLFGNEQMDKAIDYFKKCITRDANYIDAYYQMALAYLNKGEMEESKKNFQKVIELAPGTEKAAQAKEIIDTL